MSTMTTSTDSTSTVEFAYVEESDLRSDVAIALVAIVLILIMIADIFGNVIVIIAVTTYRQLKSQQSNLFILNLAFTDLSVVFTVMLWTTVAFILDMGSSPENPWIFTTGMCYFQCAMNYCLIVVSMMTLGFISIDRFVHIVYPLRYHEIITVRRIRCMICWTWVQGLIIGFVPVGMQWIHYDYCEVVCAVDWSSKHADKFVIVAFVTSFLAPAFTMLICYSVIFKRSMAYAAEIKKSMKLTEPSGTSEKKSDKRKSYENTGSLKKNSNKQQTYSVLESSQKNSAEVNGKKALVTASDSNAGKIRRHNATVKESTIIKSLLVVVLVFFICMTLFSVTKLIKVLDGYIPCWLNTLAAVIQLLNSACNPLIYGIFRKEYRKAFRIQYEKACHRMQSRFTSSEYSDSFSSPYYIDNKVSTFKRNKELANNVSVSSIEKSNHSDINRLQLTQNDVNNGIQSDTNTQVVANAPKLHLDISNQIAEEADSADVTCTQCKQTIGSPVKDPRKRFSLPKRTVSFSDTPELVNQSTEIVSL